MLKVFNKLLSRKPRTISSDLLSTLDNMSIISTESDDTLLDQEEKEFTDFINSHKLFMKEYI